MTRSLSFAVAVVLASPLSASAQAPKKAPTPAEKAATAVKEITDALKEARGVLKQVTDKATREKLELLIGRAELKATELEKELAGLKPGGTGAMSAADFASLMKVIKGESFDSGKIKLVKSLGSAPRFTASQVKEILATFSFDKDRVEAGASLYPLVVDPANFFQVMDTFTFESGRSALLEKLPKK